jgi:hypothetical protein
MTDMASVRTALIGLISFAAAEEQMLLADVAEASEQSGNAARWAAAPLVAHITEFKRQQVWRLVAIRCGQEPPGFATIDHSSPDIYQRYRDQPADEVAMDSRRVSDDLIAAVNATSDDALTGAAGAPERQLWLQVVVRGFWHPGGHLGEYYLAHGRPGRAVDLQSQAVAWAGYLHAPDPARGMASYNLACALAQTGRPDDAADTLAEATNLNPALVTNVIHDPDLGELRDSGRLDGLLTSPATRPRSRAGR